MRLMLIAGEVSGDQHAALLLRALRARVPELECFGIGGESLRAAGMHTHYDVRDMAVMGLSEVLRRYPFFRKVFGEMLALAKSKRPDALILVDYPGFNLRLAAAVHALGIPTIYYISPQVWAWNRRRIPRMAEVLDLLLAIFPFEPEVFADTDLRVEFVGHPLVDETQEALDAPAESLPWGDAPGVALLPGSRPHEVARLMPLMLAVAARIDAARPGTPFVVASASPDRTEQIRDCLGAQSSALAGRMAIVEGQTREVLRQARAALVASGTATLETALMGCPMVVVYKTSALTYAVGRMLVKLDHIAMANIVADRRLCPEFIQHEARAAPVADALLPLLEDGPERAAMREGLLEIRTRLGTGGSEARAAGIIEAFLATNGS